MPNQVEKMALPPSVPSATPSCDDSQFEECSCIIARLKCIWSKRVVEVSSGTIHTDYPRDNCTQPQCADTAQQLHLLPCLQKRWEDVSCHNQQRCARFHSWEHVHHNPPKLSGPEQRMGVCQGLSCECQCLYKPTQSPEQDSRLLLVQPRLVQNGRNPPAHPTEPEAYRQNPEKQIQGDDEEVSYPRNWRAAKNICVLETRRVQWFEESQLIHKVPSVGSASGFRCNETGYNSSSSKATRERIDGENDSQGNHDSNFDEME